MPTKVIVLVADKDDEKHGEISIVDDMKKAERLVETLIEAGFERERLRVFSGGELEIQVTHRPVVTLAKAEASSGETAEEERELEEGEKVEEGAPSAESGLRFSSLFPRA